MSRRVIGNIALSWGVLLSGCSSAIDGPEDVPEPTDAPSSATAVPKASRELALSLPDRSAGPLEVDIWEKAFRTEARRQKALISVDMVPFEVQERPGRQADGIRDAAKRSACLLVVAGPGIQGALDEAAGLGAPILAIDTPLSGGGKPLPIVTFPPAEDGARELVGAALEASKATGFPATGPALVVHHANNDPRADARADALEAALRAAKVDVLPRVAFEGAVYDAKKALLPVLKGQPRLAMVFSTDEAALPAIIEQRRARPTPDRYAIAGYTRERKDLLNVNFGQLAALIDLNLGGMIPVAVRTAIDLAAGKAIPDRTIVPQPMSRALGADLTDQLPPVPPIPTERPVPVKRDLKRMPRSEDSDPDLSKAKKEQEPSKREAPPK